MIFKLIDNTPQLKIKLLMQEDINNRETIKQLRKA